MKEDRLIDARFLNSIMAGMADVLFKWDGGVFSYMGYNVGKEMLDVIGKDLDLKGGSTAKVLEELCRQLVEIYGVADSVTITENREKDQRLAAIGPVRSNCSRMPNNPVRSCLPRLQSSAARIPPINPSACVRMARG